MVLFRFDLVTWFWLNMTYFLFWGLAFIKINILTQFQEDWIKTVPSGVYSWFYKDFT